MTAAVTYGDIVALHDNHCFVPTVSALALEGAGPFHDLAADPALMDKTAFDEVYFPADNQEHIAITPENKIWITAEIEAGISAVEDLPSLAAAGPVLYPPAPNPFNPRTDISFRLIETDRVTLGIHDLSGRLVRTLVDQQGLAAGLHHAIWNGRADDEREIASGVYFCRLLVGDQVRTSRLTLVK